MSSHQSSEEQRCTPSEASSSSQARDELQSLLSQAQARATAAEGEISRKDAEILRFMELYDSARGDVEAAQQTITQLTRALTEIAEQATEFEIARAARSAITTLNGPADA